MDKEYTPLTQRTDEDEDQEEITVPLEAHGVCKSRFRSPWCIAVVLVVFLAVNGLCLLTMNNRLSAVSRVLQPLLDFTDTRHLPRPDQYDGL
ncbi:hypothetical protein K503DRAFT_771651 [Rhizopogon vinicolor AM-OR11-026]|uniref:Uncharacterized protein n=1 Tax=Rhizopogon vinicolor AM-OR11-026 TaxID=1314800 RepID=A0A1B7MXH9_9AGAM|nr:hypothetical protein K503DRAFT_771651 [Rhizopogon vinicolor AM-OR11-026]